MSGGIIEELAAFAARTTFTDLPDEVVDDCRRVVLDSLGCALAGLDIDKGRAGIEVGAAIGGTSGEATIFGTTRRTSAFGAAYANAESMNALDFDTVLPPGHVAPYVLPGILALAEEGHVPGRRVVEAIAVSHEMSVRFGRSMDYLRTPTPEGMKVSEVLGFASTMFGAVSGAGMILDLGDETLADALGIAAAISPVNSYRTWVDKLPNSSIKYTMPGPLTLSALAATRSAQHGHSGDRLILDDQDFGYRRFIGTVRWEPANITEQLGEVWRFPGEHSYKPYPHCRVNHGPFDALLALIAEHDIKPDEIDAIRVWGEGWVEQPVWLNRTVSRPHEAQFSIAHGIAVAAHRIEPGRDWQLPETLSDPSVLALAEKVTFAPHPDYVANLANDPSARPTRVEIDARGTTLAQERTHPKGSPSVDPATYFTTEELVAKFHHNASTVLTASRADELAEAILDLENVSDVAQVLRLTAPSS